MSIIVSGGARGIGRATVDHLLSLGRRVIVVDVDVDPLQDVDSANLAVIEGDATDASVLHAAVAAAGQVSGIVASAGISRPGPSAEYSESDWQDTLRINLGAVFELMRAAAPHAASGASFVAVSSVTGSQGFAGRAAYSASKSGLEGLVRSLAVEYAPRIRVNCVMPGFVMTDIARRNIASGVISSEQILGRTPLGRWGEPRDIALAIAFLLSEDSSFITGTALPVDGGWLVYGLESSAR